MRKVGDLALHGEDCAIIIRMWTLRTLLALVLVTVVASSCKLKDDNPDGSIPAPRDVAAPPADALRTPSGLASKVLQVGLGSIHPKATSTVTVHYTGWTTDGKMFESTSTSGKPVEFPLDGVIPGWTEGVQLMVVGEKRRFWIPGHLAYDGHQGRPQGTLVFEIELLDIR